MDKKGCYDEDKKKQNKLPEAMQLQQLPTWGSIAQNFQLFFVKLWFLHVTSPVKFTNRGVWISHCTWTAPRSTWRLRRELTPAQMSLGYTGEWFKTGVLNLFTVDFRRLLASLRAWSQYFCVNGTKILQIWYLKNEQNFVVVAKYCVDRQTKFHGLREAWELLVENHCFTTTEAAPRVRFMTLLKIGLTRGNGRNRKECSSK